MKLKVNKNKIIGAALLSIPFIFLFTTNVMMLGFWKGLFTIALVVICGAALGVSVGAGIWFLLKEVKAETPDTPAEEPAKTDS